MKRICPNCHAISNSIRCPNCGTDTVPVDDIRKEPPSGYTIFNHAQSGPTPTNRQSLTAAPLARSQHSAWRQYLPAVLRVGDQVTFESSNHKGETTIASGHVVECSTNTEVISVLQTSGKTWKMYSHELLSITRHCLPESEADALKRAGWKEEPKGGSRV